MENRKHTNFILTPIFGILEDCVNATKGIGRGIETYLLCDYIMQTTFLKMTGASEQKLKCILWEIATNDFDFRYEFLNSKANYNECSNMEDKNKVFGALKAQVKAITSDENCFRKIYNKSVKDEIQKKAVQGIIDLFTPSVLSMWQGKQFYNFKKHSKTFLENHFL